LNALTKEEALEITARHCYGKSFSEYTDPERDQVVISVITKIAKRRMAGKPEPQFQVDDEVLVKRGRARGELATVTALRWDDWEYRWEVIVYTEGTERRMGRRMGGKESSFKLVSRPEPVQEQVSEETRKRSDELMKALESLEG